MHGWEILILAILAAANVIVCIRRCRSQYIFMPSLRNKVLVIVWLLVSVALTVALLLSDSQGWQDLYEIAIAINMIWPWFLLSLGGSFSG